MPDWMIAGGPVMWLLGFCSLITLTIVIERFLFWWREQRRVSIDEFETFIDHVHEGRVDDARTMAQSSENPLLNSMIDALGHGNDPRMHALHEALELEIEHAMDRTRSYLTGLDTIATLSPLLGIFGTVLGIIQSFNIIGQQSMPDPQAVGAGLSEALITTAAGLAVAMPSLIFHNFFQSLSERHVARLDKYHREFEIHAEEIKDSAPGDDS
jgi:biopolymer transport protein ExbB